MSTSFTTVFFGPFHARVALDVTAPIERASALFGPGELVRVVTASAAHQITAVRAYRNSNDMITHKTNNNINNNRYSDRQVELGKVER